MNPPCHDGTKFSWSGNKGVTEASDLGQYVDNGNSFFIKSHRTGRSVQFFRTDVKKDAEGELVSMTYKAKEGDFEVEVFND